MVRYHPKVTIKKVAQEAGVSIATVYRAVNNSGRISDQTRELVLNTVNRLGYKPNTVARGLALRRNFCILVALPLAPMLFWDDVRKGVHKAAVELSNYNVEIVEFYHSNGYVDGRSLLDAIIDTQIDAIVLSIVNILDSKKILQYLSDKKIPMATVNEDTESQERLFFYGPDNYMAGRMAAELINKFCCYPDARIGLIHTPSSYKYSTHDYRRKGFINYFAERNETHRISENKIDPSDNMSFILHNLIDEQPSIQAMYFDQYSTLLSCCDVLAEIKNRPRVIGHEYNESFSTFLTDGTITALLVQEKVCQGYYPVMMMYRFLSTGELYSQAHYYSNINIIIDSNSRNLHHEENGCGYE